MVVQSLDYLAYGFLLSEKSSLALMVEEGADADRSAVSLLMNVLQKNISLYNIRRQGDAIDFQ